ncbi:hypothetical protein B6U66_00060 [Candidatus Bathyarchaeota archaeon ex4484_135]|nr:MAG: hypothetical protein B6U66_00060 [Candidatus Bathyarchaeota archaeon ex4484_135]
MRAWAVVAKKEVKEQLRSRKALFTLIIIPVLMWFGMGLMHAFIFGAMTPTGPLATPMDMHLAVDDKGPYGLLAKQVIYAVASNMNVVVHEVTYEKGMELVHEGSTVLFIWIPANFTRCLNETGTARIGVWVDMTSTRASTVAHAMISVLNSVVAEKKVDAVQTPIRKMPITLVMLSLMLMMSALWGPMPTVTSSFAGERERKTLEVLLVTPVSRHSILLGKLLAAGFSAALYMGSSVVGLAIYNSLVTWATAGVMEEFASPALTIDQALVVIAAAVLTVILSISVGIVISCFAKSVKDAETYYSAIFMLPIMLMSGTSFTRFDELPLAIRAVILAIPFSHGVLMVNNALIYGAPWQAIAFNAAYMLVWSIGALAVGAKLFEREEIVETRKVRGPGGRRGLLGLFKKEPRSRARRP